MNENIVAILAGAVATLASAISYLLMKRNKQKQPETIGQEETKLFMQAHRNQFELLKDAMEQNAKNQRDILQVAIEQNRLMKDSLQTIAEVKAELKETRETNQLIQNKLDAIDIRLKLIEKLLNNS